ncbi:MAG: nucleotide pyrophosphohydrolase [Opitutae bacterium]
MSRSIEEVTEAIRQFRDERDWLQFHNPKDMATALSIEASELLEHFLWKSKEESQARCETHREAISEEIADIGCYLFELADNLGIDLGEAILEKIQKNAHKYPVEKARGSHAKYDEL